MSQITYALRQLAIRLGIVNGDDLMLALGHRRDHRDVYAVPTDSLEAVARASPESARQLAAPAPKTGTTSCSFAGECDEIFSYPMSRDLEAQQTVFSRIAAHRDFDASSSDGGRAEIGARSWSPAATSRCSICRPPSGA